VTKYEVFDSATRAFWTGRDLQSQRQLESGRSDAGNRGSVTGGKHFAGLEDAVGELFEPLARRGARISFGTRAVLPGYFRRTKSWDLVVRYGNELIAAVEFKSQVGSIANNFNNRTEEAIGNAVDARKAFEAGAFGNLAPWLGFFMVIEHSPASTLVSDRDRLALFATDEAFARTSYVDRYRILADRLILEGLYDAACVVETAPGGGIFHEPDPNLSVDAFVDAIYRRVDETLRDFF
jgi:hypothetical protein